eukprot:scaffold5455_cov145-Skeletonema_menzelii.AAC.2
MKPVKKPYNIDFMLIMLTEINGAAAIPGRETLVGQKGDVGKNDNNNSCGASYLLTTTTNMLPILV